MDMSLGAAHRMHESAGGVDQPAAQVVMDDALDLRGEQGEAGLGVPGQVQIQLAVKILRHSGSRIEGKRLKPNSEKPPEGG